MSEWLEIDGATEVPGWAQDGGSGDRVRLLDAGLLLVEHERTTFARWSDILATLEHGGTAYVMVPRRPPAPPWIAIGAELVANDAAQFLSRLRDRMSASGGGYRDAVRKRRQGISAASLLERVRRREAIPGALEVPSTVQLGVSYPGLGLVQAGVVGGLAYGGAIVAAVFGELVHRDLGSLFVYAGMAAGVGSGALIARTIGKVWRGRKNKNVPRQRVLVLAPDACVVGFRSGVRAIEWSRIGGFAIGRDPETLDATLSVRDLDGRETGHIGADWLDAPLPLVVAVAEAYRGAAID